MILCICVLGATITTIAMLVTVDVKNEQQQMSSSRRANTGFLPTVNTVGTKSDISVDNSPSTEQQREERAQLEQLEQLHDNNRRTRSARMTSDAQRIAIGSRLRRFALLKHAGRRKEATHDEYTTSNKTREFANTTQTRNPLDIAAAVRVFPKWQKGNDSGDRLNIGIIIEDLVLAVAKIAHLLQVGDGRVDEGRTPKSQKIDVFPGPLHEHQNLETIAEASELVEL